MVKIDARGDNCPIPVIKTKKAMEALQGADVIEVLVDNEIAVQNVTKFGENKGAEASTEKLAPKEFKVILQVTGASATETSAIETSVTEASATGTNTTQVAQAVTGVPDDKKNTIVVISSEYMGEGNAALGKVLLKGFIFALAQLDSLPNQILFYNGGATLTTEGSDSLEDLKFMEVNGVEILTCGTCLDYYDLKDKLVVGGVTNMYSIVEAMERAGKILKP